MIYNGSQFQIYFGDAADQLHLSFCRSLREKLQKQPIFTTLFKELALNDLFFLHQVHGTAGSAITSHNKSSFIAFSQEGDFLITNEPLVGIGILTADCVPIIIVDASKRVCAAIHAGWRGAAAGIVERVVTQLIDEYGSSLEDLSFFLGPSAQQCCYQVGPDFMNSFISHAAKDQFFKVKNGALYFDLPRFILEQLFTLGVKANAIHSDYNLCTICNPQFCSYRRGDHDRRQMTVVTLR